MSHYVYLVRCKDNSLYCGYTTDPERRVLEHNGELPGGARYTSGRRPVSLVYTEMYKTRSAAQQREAAIKSLTRQEKEQLCS